MKKTAIAIMMALVSIASVAQSAQKDNTWYAGGKLGFSQFHDTGWHNKSLNNSGKTHESHLGIGMTGGYQVNKTIGFEIGYNWMGRVPHKENIQNGKFKAQGIQFTSKLDYPITDDIDIYTRLGGMIWRADSKKDANNKNHDTGVSPVLAGGVEWAIAKNVATRLEYQWINNIGDSNTVSLRPDNSMLNLGVFYRFGQEEKNSLVVDQPLSSTVSDMHTKNFTLKSDILFNFNKTVLKPEGKQALDQLYSQISNFDTEEGSIIVLGFTDRIGSDAYNQDLSEKRAQSVIDYLVSKGIQRNKISIRGMGASNPVTGNSCDDITDRSELVDCLSPDRRVEIQVKNIKDITAQ